MCPKASGVFLMYINNPGKSLYSEMIISGHMDDLSTFSLLLQLTSQTAEGTRSTSGF